MHVTPEMQAPQVAEPSRQPSFTEFSPVTEQAEPPQQGASHDVPWSIAVQPPEIGSGEIVADGTDEGLGAGPREPERRKPAAPPSSTSPMAVPIKSVLLDRTPVPDPGIALPMNGSGVVAFWAGPPTSAPTFAPGAPPGADSLAGLSSGVPSRRGSSRRRLSSLMCHRIRA